MANFKGVPTPIIRRQGIDPKAKTGALRGEVCLQLKDALTGKITDEIRGHNMLTNGLESALNGCPWDLNKIDGGYAGVSGTIFPTAPIFSQLLSGVILFPQTLGNDPDLLFPSFDNIPTAYSSIEAYQQTDSKQGTFDSVSSGEITNGFRYVHTWGSAYGNGSIASLGLAPRNAHAWCKDVPSMIKPSDATRGVAQGYISYMARSRVVFAMNENYILVSDTGSGLGTLKCYKNSAPNLNIMLPYSGQIFTDDYTIDGLTINGCLWKLENGITPFAENAQIIGSYVYITSRSNSTFTVRKYDVTDGTLVSTDTYTFSASFGGDITSIYDGYIYCTKAGGGAIYKCNMSNTADVTEIADASIESGCPCWAIGTNFIYTWDGILDADTGVFVPFTSSTKFYKNPNMPCYPLWDKGMWLVGYSYTNEMVGATMKQWGLMTHFDLQNAVTKTADKQMEVQYSITQV